MSATEGEPQLPQPGSLVAGKYELVRIIGKGGMGVVYEAKHLRLNKQVAIKMLKPAALHLSEFRPRFEREARTAALLRGRHVARIFDVDATEDGLPFMVMEYLVGRDLDAELRERGTLSVQEATGYVLQACVAMQEAHAAGIIHRDLKPANLFLTEEEGERVVKVLDFGISKLTHEVDTHLTGTFATVGTPLYMSPEQVRSSRTVDARSDIWSLAVILYEALAGRPPFQGSMTATAAAIVADKTPPLSAVRPDIPPDFEAVLGKALEKHPNRRYQDVLALSAALAPFGPAQIPFASPSDPSVPGLPSTPSLSGRIAPPISSPHASDWSTAGETVLIPAGERDLASVTRPLRRRGSVKGAIAAGAAVGIVLAAGVFAGTRHSTNVGPIAVAAPATATANTTTPEPTRPGPPPMVSATVSSPIVAATDLGDDSSNVHAHVPVRSPPTSGYSAIRAATPPASTSRPGVQVPLASRPASPHPPARPPPPPANPIFLQ